MKNQDPYLTQSLQYRIRELLLRFKHSETLRRSSKNAGWSGLSFLAAPLLQLLATPYFLSKLGPETYGIWMLINSVIAVSGVASFGVGAATVKFVSQHHATGGIPQMVHTIQNTAPLYLLLGASATCALFLAAPLLAGSIFKLPPDIEPLMQQATRVAALNLLLRFAYGVPEAVSQGLQRYDIESRFAVMNSLVVLAIAVGVVFAGGGLLEILWGNLITLSISTLFFARRISLLLGTSEWIKPHITRETLCRLGPFAFWNWVQSLGTLFASQADRLIIGSLIGPTALTYYTVCLQLISVVQGFVSKALSFVFPLASALKEISDLARLRRLYAHGMCIATATGCALCLPLFLYPHSVLALWLDSETARQAAPLLPILAVSGAMLSTSIIPYFFLNGSGYARLNACSTLASGSSVLLAALPLISIFGIAGAAYSRLCNLPISIANRFILSRKILHDFRPTACLVGFDSVCITFLVCWFASLLAPTNSLVSSHGLTALFAASVIMSLPTAIAAYLFTRMRLSPLFRLSNE